jgi:CubicO group peptidase (beta-lactamase class C family)
MIFVRYANGVKTDVRTTNEKMFEERIQELIGIYNIPSISACILKRDKAGIWKIAWKNAYGKRSAVWPVFNANTDTIYSIASITKVVTATAVMQLVDKGLISLDDDVNTYLPFKIRNPGLDYGLQQIPPITVRHLLSHRSGLPPTPPAFFTKHKDILKQDYGVFMSIEDLQAYLAHKKSWGHTRDDGTEGPVYYKPGEAYCYSNVGYMILGFLIEAVINKDRAPSEKWITWQDYFNENIFKPLNMQRTKFYWDFIWKFSNEAQGYIEKKYISAINPDFPHDAKGEPLAEPACYAPGVPIPPNLLVPQKNSIINPTLIGARYSAGGAAGQILSTPSDLAYFLVVHLNHGKGYVRDNDGNIVYEAPHKPLEVSILSEESVNAMHRVDDERLSQIKPAADAFNLTGLTRLNGYGLGWTRGNLGGRYWNYLWNPMLDPRLGVDWGALAKRGIHRKPINRINGLDIGGGLEIEGHTGDTYGYHSGMYRISDDLAIIYIVNVDTTGEDRDESRIQPKRFFHYTSIMDGEAELKGFDGALPHNIVKLSEIEHLLIQKAASLNDEVAP